MSDPQKQLVYVFEKEHIAPFDRTLVPFEQIPIIVNYVWEKEGLLYPPLVDEYFPKRKYKGRLKKSYKCAEANRTRVSFPHEETYTWLILHELSHSMARTVDGKTNQHGAIFMGLYLQLCSRYLGMDFTPLALKAEQAGLCFNVDARPVFLDD